MYESDQYIVVTIVTNEDGHHLLVKNCRVIKGSQLVYIILIITVPDCFVIRSLINFVDTSTVRCSSVNYMECA